MSRIRVLIIDDHAILRRGLRSLLSSYLDIEVVGEGESGADALQQVGAYEPHIVLMDVRLPGPSGIEVTRQLRKQAPNTKIIILSAFDNREYVLDALNAGAHAYLLKNTSDETVIETIRTVHQGKHYLDPALMETVLDTVLEGFETLSSAAVRNELGLTGGDMDVLSLIARGATSHEISEQLHWSERTVKRKVEEIMVKLNVRNRAEAVAQAIKQGII